MEKFNTASYVVKHESKPTQAWLATHGLDTYFWCSADYAGPKPEIESDPIL